MIMQWFEILIIIACIAFVLGVTIVHFYLKRKGKSLISDCSGDCHKCNGTCAHKSKDELINEYHECCKKCEVK